MTLPALYLVDEASGTVTTTGLAAKVTVQYGMAFTALDVDGDGVSDIAVDDTTAGEFILHGPFDGSLSSRDADTILVPPSDSNNRCFVSAGDTDGDGLPGLWIADPRDSSSEYDAGAAWLVEPVSSGGEIVVGEEAIAMLNGPSPQAGAGFSLASGDWNGDGAMDVALGSTWWGAWVALDPSAGTVSLDMAESLRAEGDDSAGYTLTAGDLDGDAQTDLVVGAPTDSVSADRAGAAYVFLGSSLF